jgi:hypothetical protein
MIPRSSHFEPMLLHIGIDTVGTFYYRRCDCRCRPIAWSLSCELLPEYRPDGAP